ncbi:hypothetical protein JG687_00016296 [Phytophthora cactorum]|uniref:Uncharacterized protein n=1 Tax=Phytophthora cactorum TaxID=29920 RepID=A0A8T1TSL2_9STRA|nr:hypothetical protein JG687_00016296 [Phytophthora cactorum]
MFSLERFLQNTCYLRNLTTKFSTGSESATSANAKFAPTESEAWVNDKLQSTIAQDAVRPTEHGTLRMLAHHVCQTKLTLSLEPTCATRSGHTTRRNPYLPSNMALLME